MDRDVIAKLDAQPTNETKKTLFEATGVSLKATFYWDSHGKLIPFTGGPKDKKTFSKSSASVKIVERKHTLFEEEWTDWLLYVDGELIKGSVYRYNYTGLNLLLKVVVGWG